MWGKIKDWFVRPRGGDSAGSMLVKVIAAVLGGIAGFYFIKRNKLLFLVYLGGAFALAIACQCLNAQEKVFWTGLGFWWLLIWVVIDYAEKRFASSPPVEEKKSFWSRLYFWK